jgi:NAD(P)H dehydrogenase (quinone)
MAPKMATVALIGVKGNLGYKIFPELVKSDAIAKVHVLSRKKRNSGGGKVVDFQVDYHDPASLEMALKGVDTVINTMGTEGDFQKAKHNLIDVAAKVGVKLYFPRLSTSEVP